MLPEDLIEQLRVRAADPVNRSDGAAAMQGALQEFALPGPAPQRVALEDAVGGGALGGIMQMVAGALASGRGINPQHLAEQVAEDVRTGKTSMAEIFGDSQPGVGIELIVDEDPDSLPREFRPPASQDEIILAEAGLGAALPDDLKQLYTQIGNGGFGPSVGFRPLDELVQSHRAYCAEPQGPNDEMWPPHLLPLIPYDIGEICYDLQSGKIIYWDPEELIDDESDAVWDRSFVWRADSLAGWLETWLGEKPTQQRLAEQLTDSRLDSVRTALDYCRTLSPDERSAMGLPEKDWEAQLCRNHGVDPDEILS